MLTKTEEKQVKAEFLLTYRRRIESLGMRLAVGITPRGGGIEELTVLLFGDVPLAVREKVAAMLPESYNYRQVALPVEVSYNSEVKLQPDARISAKQ
jgi:hypothetical protein